MLNIALQQPMTHDPEFGLVMRPKLWLSFGRQLFGSFMLHTPQLVAPERIDPFAACFRRFDGYLIYTGGVFASIDLPYAPHTQQRVRVTSQHELL